MLEIWLELSEPKAGWMPVSLRSGNDEWHCRASYIFDCVNELVYAALELTEMREARPVTFFEEPEACRLSMAGNGDAVHVTITKHRDSTSARNAKDGTVVFSTSVTRASLTNAIWSAVNRLETTIGRARIEAEWRTAFPAKELAQLGERVG